MNNLQLPSSGWINGGGIMGGDLESFLRPLRKVIAAALPNLRLGPGWCSRPVSLNHCLMEKVSRRDATPLGSMQ